MNFRQILSATLVLTAFFGCSSILGDQANVQAQSKSKRTIDLIPAPTTSKIVRIQTRLEGKGTVQPTEDKSLSLTVDGRFEYDERIIARSKLLKSIRDYKTAEARISIDRKPNVNRLNKSTIVIAQTNGLDEAVRLASVGQPLTQQQFELINTPANTLILAEVFKKKNIQKGDSWKPNNLALARFLNIDSIQDSDVDIRLEKIQGDKAILFVSGDASGTIDGTTTQITVSGTAHFDIRKGIVNSCELTLSQQRDIGLLTPGLDAVFKIVMRIQPISNSRTLSNEGLAQLRKNAGKITDSLTLQTKSSPTSILHPRDWRLISNSAARTILRYTDGGQMLGQCDIIPLPKRITSTPQTLDQFKQSVLNGIEDKNAQIISSNQSTSGNNIDILKVVARGTVNGVDLIWTYYTLTHEDGRRVQLVFTTEPKQQRRFAGTDRLLIDTLRFDAAKPTTQNAGFSKKK